MTIADIVFALFCVLVLPFAYGQFIPPGRICSCVGGLTCDFTYVYCAPFDIGECRRENVALGQRATISSLFEVNKDFGNAACVGVNGNIKTQYVRLDEYPTEGNCIHTVPWQEGIHFWEVDLGKNYLIKYITVYPRLVRIERMRLVSVMVERTNCYTFTNPVLVKPYYNIECKPSVRGRYVRLEKPPFQESYGIKIESYCINVCEVQVWVCRQGFYGEECKERCDPCANCDIVTGACSGGCKVGHYGHRCLQTCSYCVDNMCNDQGICQAGCKTGFEGEKCDLTLLASQSESTENGVGVGMYVGIGFLILALLASGLTCYIMAVLRKKKEEGGEGNVITSQETETLAVPENDEPDAQETVVELTPYPHPGKGSSETETPAAPENDEPDAQKTVVELTPYPPSGKESSV